jgi:hypothetical protein
MTDLQLYIASLTVSLVQISAIRDDIREIRADTRAQLTEIRSDIKLLTGKVYEMMGQK